MGLVARVLSVLWGVLIPHCRWRGGDFRHYHWKSVPVAHILTSPIDSKLLNILMGG